MMKRVSIAIVALASSAESGRCWRYRRGRKSVQEMYSVPYHRRNCQKLDRPNPKRPERTHVRLGGRLQLLGCEQKFRDRLERSDLQGIHQRSQGEDPGTKMVFPGIKDEKEAEDLWSFLEQFGPDGKKK